MHNKQHLKDITEKFSSNLPKDHYLICCQDPVKTFIYTISQQM